MSESGYGRGDRADYYNRWNAMASSVEADTSAEEAAEKAQADAALGLNQGAPRSAAEKADMEKREALKKMKEVWSRRQELEEASKCVLEGENGADRAVTEDDLQGKRVLLIKDCKDCRFELGSELSGLIKLFVEQCEDLRLSLQCSLVTSHVEMAHVKGATVELHMPLHTVQLDMCSDVSLRLRDGLVAPARGRPAMADYTPASPRVVHAGVTGLSIEAKEFDGRDIAEAPEAFSYDVALEHEAQNEGYEAPPCPPQEVQWVTQPYMGENNTLMWETARLVRVGERFLTPRELEEEKAVSPLEDRSIDVKGTVEGAMNNALSRKEQGNEAFKGREYMQAMALYTMAIESAPQEASVATPENQGKPLVAVCRANRAACFLKLGQPEKAVEDAEECTRLAPTFAKGHFRLGMAYHAMDKFEQAMPHLLRARDLAPKDSQVKEAIKFCEFRAQEARRKASAVLA